METRSRTRCPAAVVLAAFFAVAGPGFAGAPPGGRPALPGALAVDLVNDGAESVSVRAGSDNGVTAESDFVVVVTERLSVPVYPAELFPDRFWSQPLPTEVYQLIRPGMAVRPAPLSTVPHSVLRAEGRTRLDEKRAKQEEARRQAARRRIAELRDKRLDLVEQRDLLEDKISTAEAGLADEEGRLEWATNSADDDIDRASQRIADLADRREELQSRRSATMQQPASARGDGSRLASEIRLVNGQIGTERDKIRFARERKRQARAAYSARREEWQKLVARRNGLNAEIVSIDGKVRELSGR